MSCKHLKKYFQKYYIFFSSATAIFLLYACSTTKKVPEGDYLLVKNSFKYEDGKLFEDELPDYVLQKPNKKALFLFPVGLWMYNAANPKYDSLLNEYMTYPSNMRNQDLRDSLFVKYNLSEDIGRNLLVDRFLHNIGNPPVILEQGKTEQSAANIRKRMVYRGYWDASVKFNQELDSAAKKAKVNYLITHKDPTYIKDYYYNIPDKGIKAVYEERLNKSIIKSKQILDQTDLEKEIKRINDLMKSKSYYAFNNTNEEIFFTADTLDSRKNVPLTMEIHKDSLDTPYKKTTIGNIDVAIVENTSDFPHNTEMDSLRGIRFHKIDNQYTSRSLWRSIILTPDSLYQQKNLDLTKRNILAMNNFSILKARDSLRRGGTSAPNDSILDVLYLLKPLPKYELKLAADANYSQLLSIAAAPSADLTQRNIFGGAENLSTSVSGIFGSIRNPRTENGRLFAYEISAQANLSFPRLLLPFSYYKLIPKRFSPTTSISLGAALQNNIGLGRVNFNAGLTYAANVNDIVSHRLTLFNTQFSFTRNKDKYYDFFIRDRAIRDEIFEKYSPALKDQFDAGLISSDQFSEIILADVNFVNSLTGDDIVTFETFQQSLLNKVRQTQDVLISSMIYNFVYNEIGKKEYNNPFYFNGKVEVSGNILSLLARNKTQSNLVSADERTIFKIPYSQFVKFDIDVRKYFNFGKNTLALRQFIGVGIPYGNSDQMPIIRSYFNGGSNDIRAWTVFGGLGPADSQLDERVRAYIMDNVKLTTNVEFRYPLNDMYELAAFTDVGNIWSLKDNGFGDEFKFNKFYKQVGIGSGLGFRINLQSYFTLRFDFAYKVYNPNKPEGSRWVIANSLQKFPTLNIAFGYPF